MANSLLTSFFAKPQFKITNSMTGLQVVASIKIIDVDIKFISRPMRHMREDGSTIVDTRIIQATEIEVVLMCPDISALAQVNNLVADRTSTYDIVTRGVYLYSMMVDHDSIRQIPDVLSASPISITFKELLVQGESPVIYAQAADASIIDRGIAVISSSASTVSSLASQVL